MVSGRLTAWGDLPAEHRVHHPRDLALPLRQQERRCRVPQNHPVDATRDTVDPRVLSSNARGLTTICSLNAVCSF